MKRKLAWLISGVCALACVATVGVVSLNTQTAEAVWTNEGGVDHYTDMTSNGEDLEYYDTLYNEDWDVYNGSNALEGDMPSSWGMTNDKTLRFTPSASNTTGSFVWSFTYTCTNAATGFYVYPLSNGSWNGSDFFDYHSCGFAAGKTYDVELGVVKVKNNDNYYVFVKVDDVFKIGTYRAASSQKGNDLYFYIAGEAAGTAVSQKPAVVVQYEDYAVVQNDDLGIADNYTVPSADATNSAVFTNDLSTASFVYKFNFTPAESGDAIVYMRANYWGGQSKLNCFFRGSQIIYQIDGVDYVVSDLFTMGKTFVVELGAIDVKDSDNTWIFVNVDGETVLSQTVDSTVAAQTKGVSFYGNSAAVFAKYSYKVSANGETKEVVSGQALGELPTPPASEFEFLGWADQDGNIVTAETVVTSNLQLTPLYNEPHTVTFVVNGKTFATVENVGYKGTVALPECSLPGYNFVKWVYGDDVEFTSETEIVSNLTVTAVLEKRDFTAEELADYVVGSNKALGAAATIKHTNSGFANYAIPAVYETSSGVYRFVYEKGEKPLYLVMRDVKDGWGANADGSAVSGYTFILNGATLETPVGDPITDAFATENNLYLVEIAVIDVKASDEAWIYVTVNGNKIVDGRMEQRANVGYYIGMYGDDASTSTLNEVSDYHTIDGVLGKHTVVNVEELAATCTEEGYTAHSYCEDCKEVFIAKETIDALGHEEETVKGYAATCMGTGLTDGVVCNVCEAVITEQTEISALGHDLQAVEAVAPTCEGVGAKAGERCIREGCNQIVSGCEEVPAKGHTAVVDAAIPSTCMERGKSEGSHCGECEKVLVAQESLPLSDHTFENGECTVCGEADEAYVPDNSTASDSVDGGTAEKSGCSGSIASLSCGMIAMVGLAMIRFKKRKEE